MDPPLETDAAVIVLIGAFNPSIFQPSWLAAHGLIRNQEAEQAEIGVVHREISAFAADWLRLQVTTDRFVAQTTDTAHFPALRDLVVATFELLEHTPFDKLGVNRLMHYRMPTIEKWHAFGHLLVPKTAWREVLGEEAGMRSLVVVGKELEENGFKTNVTVRVEPSARVLPGVFFEVNDHSETTGEDSGRRLLTRLRERWEAPLDRARSIAEHLLSQEY